MNCKSLFLLLICASIIVPFGAGAKGDEMHHAAALAGMHCQFWLRQLQQLPPPASYEEYRQILGRKLPVPQVQRIHIASQGLPDFGFILGARWDVATLRERNDFNHAFLNYLQRQQPFIPDSKGDYCVLEVSLTPQDPNENNDIFVELPQPRLLQANVVTQLPGQHHPITLEYHLTQDLIGWQIEEITLNGVRLRKKYSAEFSQQIARGGYAQLIQWLSSENTTPPVR